MFSRWLLKNKYNSESRIKVRHYWIYLNFVEKVITKETCSIFWAFSGHYFIFLKFLNLLYISVKPMFSYCQFHLFYHTEIWKCTCRKWIVTLLGFSFNWVFLYTMVYKLMLLLVCYWLAVLATSEMLCFNKDRKIDKFDINILFLRSFAV